MPKLETIEDLNSLHTNQIQESSTLEYKASPAVANAKVQEIAKDISAMANAEGGQFVYGMRESNHVPAGLDDGHSSTPYNGLWFEQIIQQNISPRVEGLKIKQVQANDGNVYTIIDVPASKTVHQSGDGRYYRRRNFRNDIMKDYEIREAINRSTTPDLVLGLDFGGPASLKVEFLPGHPKSQPIPLHVTIANKSDEPALYTVVRLLIDAALSIQHRGEFTLGGVVLDDAGNSLTVVYRSLVTPQSTPVFKGITFGISGIELVMNASQQGQTRKFRLRYEIFCPRFSTTAKGILAFENDELKIQF
jgi:hypothetical protein